MAKDIHANLLFAGVDPQYVDHFLKAFPRTTQVKKGEVLWRQNEEGTTMCLLVKGRLEVVLHSSAEAKAVVIPIEAGAIIGEVCVFGLQRRSADVRAAQDSELIVVEGEKFREMVKQKDMGALQMSFNVAKMLTQRLAVANDFIRKLQQLPAPDQATMESEIEHYRERFFEESLFN